MDLGPPSLLLLACLLHFTPVAAGQPSYIIDAVGLQIHPSGTVQSGTAVTLRCEVSVIHDNIPDLNHTFQLTRDSEPLFSVTTAADSIAHDLDPARAADSGSYECRVTVKDKRKNSHSQTLTVTGLQTPILLLSTTRPFNGEEFTAMCSAPEEKGSLKFQFYQRYGTEEPLKIKETGSMGNSLETTLVLRQVKDSFLFCNYEINLVSSGTRRSNRSEEIQVVVRALLISPTMNVLPSSDVFEGELVEVVCKVVKPPTGVVVFLTKDKRIIKEANSTIVHRFVARHSDSGEYVCMAEWRNVNRETYRSITVKELFSKPHLTVKPMDIFEGDSFMLTCFVTVHEEQRVERDNLQFVIYRDRVNLTDSRVYTAMANPDANGNYTCEVSLHKYLTQSIVKKSASVALTAKVPVSSPRLSVVGGTLVLGKPFQLLCRSNSGTLPITYILYGPGVQHQSRTVSRPGERAVFSCPGVLKAADLDKFLCHAKNSNARSPAHGSGQQLRHSADIIEPVSKPLVHPGAWSVSEGQTLTLVCSVNQGTPPIRFSWYHDKKEAPLKSRSSSRLEESYSVANVKREDEGQYYCASTNAANDTKESARVSIAVTLAGWKKGLIAVLCIVLMLTLILGCVFKGRLRKCQSRRMGELSVKSAGTKVERLSLTQAEFNQAANVTPGMIGKSIWGDHVSGSESDDQNSVAAAELEHTGAQTLQADPHTAPAEKGTDAVYGEVTSSKSGVAEQADGQGSVEYAQLNHDADHHGDDGNHDNQSVHQDHIAETDDGGGVDAGTCEE